MAKRIRVKIIVKHNDDTAANCEARDDAADRRVARQGLNKSSLWLPGNMMCNSRLYVDPELKKKYTSKVRTLVGPELERVKAELMAREAKRK